MISSHYVQSVVIKSFGGLLSPCFVRLPFREECNVVMIETTATTAAAAATDDDDAIFYYYYHYYNCYNYYYS